MLRFLLRALKPFKITYSDIALNVHDFVVTNWLTYCLVPFYAILNRSLVVTSNRLKFKLKLRRRYDKFYSKFPAIRPGV